MFGSDVLSLRSVGIPTAPVPGHLGTDCAAYEGMDTTSLCAHADATSNQSMCVSTL